MTTVICAIVGALSTCVLCTALVCRLFDIILPPPRDAGTPSGARHNDSWEDLQ